MTLSSVDLYRYSLPLTAPLHTGGQKRSVRQGLLVRFESAEGRVGWGEAAPLPGFSDETLGKVVSAAGSLEARLSGTRVPLDGALDGVLQGLLWTDDLSPSLRFAVEGAFVHLVAQAQGQSMASVLGNPRNTIAVNALLPNPVEGGKEKALALREAGYEAVKVKVGQASVEEEAECIRTLYQALGDDVTLRLDANRAWSLTDALRFAEAVADVPIAYLEEPLADPGTLPDLAARTSLPLALDETTREVNPAVLDEASFLAAVVLKPTLLGGFAAIRRWVRQAERHAMLPVLSAAYESGVGLQLLGALAATLPATPVGLSTYDRLAADVVTPRLPLGSPTVAVDALLSPSVEVKTSSLEPVDATRYQS